MLRLSGVLRGSGWVWLTVTNDLEVCHVSGDQASCGLRWGRLRGLAKASDDANQTRRLLALAAIYDGSSRAEAARLGGVDRQSLRDWVIRFNAEGPAGLIDRWGGGRQAKLSDAERRALSEAVERGPTARDGVVRWRLVDLAIWIWDEFAVAISVPSLSRELRAMGYRKLSARPRHYAQAPGALETFKKTSLPSWQRLPSRRPRARP